MCFEVRKNNIPKKVDNYFDKTVVDGRKMVCWCINLSNYSPEIGGILNSFIFSKHWIMSILVSLFIYFQLLVNSFPFTSVSIYFQSYFNLPRYLTCLFIPIIFY